MLFIFTTLLLAKHTWKAIYLCATRLVSTASPITVQATFMTGPSASFSCNEQVLACGKRAFSTKLLQKGGKYLPRISM